MFEGRTYYVTIKEARGPVDKKSLPAPHKANVHHSAKASATTREKTLPSTLLSDVKIDMQKNLMDSKSECKSPYKRIGWEFTPIYNIVPISPCSVSCKIETGKLTPRAYKNRKARLIKIQKKQEADDLALKTLEKEAKHSLTVFSPTEVEIPKYVPPTLKAVDGVAKPILELWERFQTKYTLNHTCYVESIPKVISCKQLPLLKPIKDGKCTSMTALLPSQGQDRIGEKFVHSKLMDDLYELWRIMGSKLKKRAIPTQIAHSFCSCSHCKSELAPPWERDAWASYVLPKAITKAPVGGKQYGQKY